MKTILPRRKHKKKESHLQLKLLRRWELISTIVDWARKEYFTPSTGGLHRSLSYFMEKSRKVLFSRGVTSVVPFVKGARSVVLQWIAAPEDSPEARRWRRKVRKYFGRHVSGKDLKTSSRRNILRSMLTALITTRSLIYPAHLDIQPIVGELYRLPYDGWVKDVRGFWKELGFGRPTSIKDFQRSVWTKYHLSTKAGPNGPAMWSALADLEALPESLMASIGFLGGETLKENMRVLRRNLLSLGSFFPVYRGQKNEIRKIIGISDKEKPRTVAILDYWSQTVLRPVHFFLFGILRRIPQDVTFDQGSFLEKVQAWDCSEYYSIDLKNATDRFPVDLICTVLEGGFTREWVSHWRNIMVGSPFLSDQGRVSYRVGNPMGAYSSWASFALAHHFVMYDCCRELKIPWRTAQYVILGDDILIGSVDLAVAYRHRISDLGVEVSIQKTLVSQDTFEFAKRYFHRGEEITPFPVSAITDTYQSIPLLVSAMVGELRRDLCPMSGIPGAVGSLYRRLHKSSSFVKKVELEAFRCELSVGFSNGSLGALEFLSKLLGESQSAGLRENGFLNAETANLVIKDSVHRMFTDSLSNPKLDLGRLAVDLVERFTGGDDRFTGDGFLLIYALPFLGCYGQIEEMYLRSLNQHRLELEEDFDGSLVRALMIPLSDQAFTVPVREQRMLVHGKFAATVLETARKRFSLPAGPSRLRTWDLRRAV